MPGGLTDRIPPGPQPSPGPANPDSSTLAAPPVPNAYSCRSSDETLTLEPGSPSSEPLAG